MYKQKITNLLHTMASFIVMLIISRICTAIIKNLDLAYLGSLIVFLISSAAAVVCFKIFPKTAATTEKDSESANRLSADSVIKNSYDEDETPPIIKSDILYSVASLIISISVMTGLMYILNLVFVTPEPSLSAVQLNPLYFISLVLIHPVIEEYIFRNLFYGELRLLSPIFACFVQAIMFALSHGSVSQMIYALVCGLVLAILIENTGRYICAVIAHAAINLRSLIFSTALAGYYDVRRGIDILIMIIGAAMLVAIILIRSKSQSDTNQQESETHD